jgi:hypothetical protein
MRFIRTFLLTLYVAPDAPDRLCGDLRPLETREVYPFKNETGLMKLLHKMFVPSKDRGQSVLSNHCPTRS